MSGDFLGQVNVSSARNALIHLALWHDAKSGIKMSLPHQTTILRAVLAAEFLTLAYNSPASWYSTIIDTLVLFLVLQAWFLIGRRPIRFSSANPLQTVLLETSIHSLFIIVYRGTPHTFYNFRS